jgi:hypothetical protein
MENEKLTQEMLKENLHYEPASGVLTWLETEELPEEVISNHYLYIVLNDKSFTKKRLIMLWMTGELPEEGQIEHIDGDTDNNRFSNIRLKRRKQKEN